ncbi:MAG TPA: SDR family oxidoreductase, partial [Candidatus Limnocylindria bacterium]|nr:SDR family oxidoreductase [Candidatus Limnocylindria bacterium]
MSPGPPGSVTIVAGATGKLGRAIVARLLDGGHAVIGVSRGRAEALAGAPPAFEACRADLRDDGCTTALRAAIAGRPVAAVVNAAGAAQRGDVVEVQPEAIGALVDLKVGGLLRLVRAADPWLVDGSRIVALGGRLGYDADHRAAAAGVANAAVANLVRQLAQAYGPRGVTAHVIAPGA